MIQRIIWERKKTTTKNDIIHKIGTEYVSLKNIYKIQDNTTKIRIHERMLERIHKKSMQLCAKENKRIR